MDELNYFQQLAKNHSTWFKDCLQIAILKGLVNEEMFRTKRSINKGGDDLLKRMVTLRYAFDTDDHSKEWLLKYSTFFEFGAVGFLIDILYIEADESSEDHLPCHLHELPKKLPDTFIVFVGQTSHTILQTLVELEVPDVIIFGKFHSNKTFLKKFNEDSSSAIHYFAEKYCSTYD